MSSISDAINKIRPDLNKQTKFQRGDETPGMAPAPTFVRESHSAGTSGVASSGRKFKSSAFEEATTRLSMDDLRLLPADAAPGAMHGWFGLAWLATTRSRVLASTLAAVTLGLGVGFFPKLGDVSGRSQTEEVAMTPDAASTVGAAADAEAAAVVQRRSEGSKTIDIKVSESPAQASSPAAMASAAPVAEAAPAAPKVSLSPIRMSVAAAATGTAMPTLIVRSPGKSLDATTSGGALQAAAPGSGSAPVMVSSAAGAAKPLGVDEPLPPKPTAYPQVEEIFYEAVPKGDTALAKPAGGDAAKAPAGSASDKPTAKAPAAAASSSPAKITLSGIFWDEKTPMAMINGEIVEVGATIQGAKVIEIHQETVILQQDGMRRTLAL